MASSSNLNKQRRSGDNLYIYRLTMGVNEDAVQPRWTEKVYAHGHCQFTQHHSYSNGRERIYGDPPAWLKGMEKEAQSNESDSDLKVYRF